MITELLGILKNIECNSENVSNICAEKLSDYDYSFGSSKIVIHYGEFVVKKIFGNAPKNEVEIYKAAREAKLNEFFATSMLASEGGIYIQEAVDIALNDYVAREAKNGNKIKYGEMREQYREMGLQEMLYRSDCCVLYYLLLHNNLESILELQKFIVEQDLIDLQFYNAGFNRYGHLVFFDYSGIDMELIEEEGKPI